MANRGVPNNAPSLDEWEKDAVFLADSFNGIKSIAWVDKNFSIRMIVPYQENKAYINQKANDVILDPSDVNLWIPVYTGTELEGFVLGTINVDAFISPLINDIKQDYMLQLLNEGKTIFTSGNWEHPPEGFVASKTTTLQNAAVLNLSFAPTDEYLNSEIAEARKTLAVSLLFSFITIIAVYFAQNYNALSKLNESRYRELLEDVQLVTVLLDVNGRVTFCNDHLLALTGWKREEVLGQDWFARFLPPGWEQVKETFLSALPDGTIAAQYENPILTRTGEQRWVMFNNTILRDTRGKIIGTASLGEDITERKHAKEEIITLNDRLHHLINAIKELSSAHTLEKIQRIVSISARELTGADGATIVFREGDLCYYADEEAIAPLWKGKRFPLTSCISGWVMLNRTPAVIADIYADKRISAEIYKPTFVKSLAVIPVNTKDPIAAIGNYWSRNYHPSEIEIQLLQTLADATAQSIENVQLLNELEERVRDRTTQLDAANKELEAFAYTASHDLRAPLRGIDGFTRILMTEYQDQLDDEGKRVCAIIRESTQRMGQLIDDLLEFSRLSRAGLQKSVIDMKTMVNSVYREVTNAESRARINLQVGDICNADGDPVMIRQVWINLLSNAVKFTSKRETATISVSGQKEEGKCVYCIKDNGAGFNMKYANKLFGVFQRLHGINDFEGTGVGLAIIQRIVHRHGGEVWAEAEVDKGATFYFSLPASIQKEPGETNEEL